MKKLLIGLMAALPLFGCAVPEKFTQPVKSYYKDWPDKGIRATFDYNTRQVSGYEYRSRCAGEVAIENYGDNNFKSISLKLSFYSSSKQLIAMDMFYLSSGLISGGTFNIRPDYNNPLDSPDVSRYFADCPDNMDSAQIELHAY